MLTKQEKDKRLRESELLPRIQARDAEVGKDYLTVGLLYKVTIISLGENVTVLSESDGRNVSISAGTELIVYDPSLHIPQADSSKKVSNSKKKDPSTKTEKALPKEPKMKMSSIITPGLLAGKSPEVIADEVLAAIPSAPERKVLIQRIKGPRVTYLIEHLKKKGDTVPDHLLAMASKKEKTERVETPAAIETPAAVE